jgi:fatty acid desaturase
MEFTILFTFCSHIIHFILTQISKKMKSSTLDPSKRAGTNVRMEPNLTTDFPLTPTGWPYKDPYDFIDGKRVDDQVPKHLHRVHDKLYDLKTFEHPGGILWLDLTRGTDITELFETHHLNYQKATTVLAKHEVQSGAPLPLRRSLLTFHKDGFYATFREKVWKKFSKTAQLGPSTSAVIFADTMAVISTGLIYLAGTYVATSMQLAICTTVLVGIVNGFFIGIGHNFMHQKTNFRRFYMDISGFSCAEFRMHHALSHHPFTNTPLDAEINSLLPLGVSFFSCKKTLTDKIRAGIALPLLITFGIPIKQLSRFVRISTGTWRGEREDRIAQLIPIIQFILFTNCNFDHFSSGLVLWLLMLVVTSSVFLWGNFLNGPHFNDECWHQGDTLDSTDWGILQVQTSVERSELSSKDNIFANLFNIVTFNFHHLHHLFPTIDATFLSQLDSLFEEHCQEHNVVFSTMDNYSLARGLYRCIISAYDEPNDRTRNGIYLKSKPRGECTKKDQ